MNSNHSVNILIVEDNPSDAELTLRALKKNNLTNNIITLKDGEEVIDFLTGKGKYENRNLENKPKVILLDLKLPKLTGLEVLRIMKADERTKYIPVVMLTSSKEDKDIKEAYELGVNSYIVKPVEFDKFIKAVSEVGLYWRILNQPLE